MSAVAKPVMGDRAVGGLIGLDGRRGSDYVRCCAAGGLISWAPDGVIMMECGVIMRIEQGVTLGLCWARA